MASLHESVDGVVVRVRDVGESDRYLSVLTADIQEENWQIIKMKRAVLREKGSL